MDDASDKQIPAKKAGGGGTLNKENVYAHEDVSFDETRSPESIATSTASESSFASSRQDPGSSSRSLHYNMPRTSSIDSAVSSVSATSAQHKGQADARDLSPSSIQNLISTAGSAENLIVHLLKEKNHAATQNTQLWKLVEKQRALLLGLNKDLERVTKDRDKYKKKLKEWQSQGSLPRAATQSPSQNMFQAHSDSAVQPPEMPNHESSIQHSTQESTPKDAGSPVDAPGPAIVTEEVIPTSAPITAPRPDLQALATGLARPTFAFTEATPLNEKPIKGFQNSRKATPKPLNLLQSNNEQTQPALVNPADRALLADEKDDEEPRGRRKTREEDDRDRELSLKKDQEARSKSKKKPAPLPNIKETAEQKKLDVAPAVFTPLPASPRPPQGLVPGSAINASHGGSLNERLISLPLKSPGLPATPRPMGQNAAPFGSLPMSPRVAATPLSPRAPKQPIPAPMMSPNPFTDPAIIQRQNMIARHAAIQSQQQQDRLHVHQPSESNEVPAVFQGLVSSNYPNLLLPPNALPSIQIKVASSRLRPSRNSMLGLRTMEDSTVFSLSVFARASRSELWRIEKIPATLPQLEQQLRPRCNNLPRIPDRKLFSGHSPALIDARRQAVDAYFEELLDMEIDEPSALIICRFLSTDVLDPASEPSKHVGVNQDSMPQVTSLSGKVVKTGFLTKRGKSFGGWKSRYFVLDSPELRYFETPGGPHLGTIKLGQAKIGTQKPEDPASNDPDDQYRHAFLIQEPKKKDSTSYVRHVLCAESDTERDQWVTALLHYVEAEDQNVLESPRTGTNSSSVKQPIELKSHSSIKERTTRMDDNHSSSPSPTSAISTTDSAVTEPTSRNANISAPMNGAPIQDSSQWGNRSLTHHPSKDKGSKLPNIFHFKKSSQEQLYQNNKQQDLSNKPRVLRHNGYVRAVFGLPLSDAVEYCSPFSIDVQLPAVVYRSIEYLRHRKAANEEGLFRLSGSNIVVKTLKERFNTEGDIDLIDDGEYYDVHAVASLFKTYLRELPSPILTRDLHIEFLKVLELDTQEEKVKAFNVLVHRLPPVNFSLLRAMSDYLLEVTENSGKNKMSIRNMGIVFSPTVNIPTPVFNLFLSEFEAIFQTEPPTQESKGQQPQLQRAEVHVPANLSAGDIRSPRHQMFSDIPTPAYHQTNFSQDSTTSAGSGGVSAPGHQSSGSGEFGFTPLHPSYENGQYVSMPQEMPRTQAIAPPISQQQSGEATEEMYGSLNRMLVPNNAATAKQRKRESAMLF